MQYESSFSPFMRTIASIVIVTFTMLILQPAAMAAQVMHEEYKQAVADKAREQAVQLTKTLQTVEVKLAKLQTIDTAQLAELNLGQTKKSFRSLKQQVVALDEAVRVDFATTKQHLVEQKLPVEILQRHQTAVATYQQHLATLLANLEAIIMVKNKGQLHDKVAKALKHLQPLQKQGKYPKFDPNNLPFNVPDGKVRPPLEDKQELKKLFPAKPIKLAATTLLPEMLAAATIPDSSYLEATEDVQITPEIDALALELGHNPVKIYNWVHDNIKFIPTYGSIQG
ncbi:MAG: hypothetical protein IMF12_00195, partial [Proteobacteria bacterium]|nr:hypothetical protein [Pseudomonadota bacterium]